MKLETVRILADNGEPLVITTEPAQDGVIIRREGCSPVLHQRHQAGEDLKRRLKFYPRPVTIDGSPLRRMSPPTRSEVMVLTPLELDTEGQKPQRSHLGTEHHGGMDNTIAGGVLIRLGEASILRMWDDSRPVRRYLSQLPGTAEHHGLLQVVELRTMMEIRADELHHLYQTPHGIALVERREIREAVNRRVRELEDRTISVPGMPAPYRGPVHLAALVPEEGDHSMVTPAPIRVMGTPAVLETGIFQGPDSHRGGEFVTVAQALYDGDSELVPVDANRCPGEYEGAEETAAEPVRITSAEFAFRPENPERVSMVESITMTVQTQDGRTVTAPARFHLSGGWSTRPSVRAVRGVVEEGEVLEAMKRAFWRDLEWNQPGEMEEERRRFEERMERLASHLFGDPRGAMEQELRNATDRFHTDLPRPPEPVTVTSRDGRITITMNPENNTEAENKA